ncbi:MAG: chorismate synthase [Lachnospiraceae bacterium]|nr:chorismate synthase [Lachnospiraceae bacterium]
MAGSTFGKVFTVTTWGESHGPAVGCVVDGCPAGLPFSEDDVQTLLDLRRPGGGGLATARKEADRVRILSGVFGGKTTGTPISMMVENTSHRSKDYSELAEVYRPGHADFTFDAKFGFRDYNGGGRASARETIGRVAAGAVAMKLLAELGITVESRVVRLAGRDLPADGEADLSPELIADFDPADSYGGVIECVAKGLPAGLGEPVFDKLDAEIAKAVMSIGAVKGVEIGDGFRAADAKGSENNDCFAPAEGEEALRTPLGARIAKTSNHAGGTLGGISDGADLIVRAAFKPTPSIGLPQRTVTRAGEPAEITIEGRHDAAVVKRAPVIVSSMVALVLADLLLRNMSAKLENVKNIYGA